jgi:hypothetical protein
MAGVTSLSFMIHPTPEVVHLSIDLHIHLIKVPAPVAKGPHQLHTLPADLTGGPNLFHQKRTVSWQISIPRSDSRSSTFLSDRGYFTYIITTRRITSGELK